MFITITINDSSRILRESAFLSAFASMVYSLISIVAVSSQDYYLPHGLVLFSCERTPKYTQFVNFKDDDYEVTMATTEDEIKALGKAGFMKYDEHNGIHFYRKPKRFVSLA